MKRNFDEIVCDLDGAPVQTGMSAEAFHAAMLTIWEQLPQPLKDTYNAKLNEQGMLPLTLGRACVKALLGAYDEEKNMDDIVRVGRMELARKIHKGGVIDIEPKDRDMIKPLIKKMFLGVMVPVLLWEMLEKDAGDPPTDSALKK